jgi:AbrB family looped-hinge helix DNA binding protein
MLGMSDAIVSSKYQITIPREVRRALGLKPGDKLLVVLMGDDMIVLRKPKSYRAAITGIGRGLYPADYLKKERESWE